MDDISRKINILLNVEKSFLPKAEYVFRTFCKVIGLQPVFFYNYSVEDINVYYGQQGEESYPIEIYHNRETSVFFDKKSIYRKEDVHFVKYRNDFLPFLFSLNGLIFNHSPGKIIIRKDIVASTFYFISCWEEYVLNETAGKQGNGTDNHRKEKSEESFDERISAAGSSLAQVLGFSHIPVIDRYCEIFQKAVEIVMPGYKRENSLLKEEKLAVSYAHIADFPKDAPDKVTKKVIFTVERLIGSEKKKKIASTLFLPLAGNQKRTGIDLSKKVDDANRRTKPGKETKNHLVGIYSDKPVSTSTINTCIEHYSSDGRVVKGYCLLGLSEHYTKLFNILEDTEILYDISIFNSDEGFRAGTTLPFHPFNIEENKPFRVLEVPAVTVSFKTKKVAFPFNLFNKLLSMDELFFLLNDAKKFSSFLSLIVPVDTVKRKTGERKKIKKIYSYGIRNKALQVTPDFLCDKWLTR